MNISVKENTGEIAVLVIEGEVDMMSAPDVRDTLVPLFLESMRGIVVDLSGVTYMDSSGIATMIEGLQWSTREGKRFIVSGLNKQVMDVFVLTNLKDVFEFAQNSQSAFDNIAGS
jgi:anti-sigma B factor antagonist